MSVLIAEWGSAPHQPELIAASFIVDGHPLLELCEGAAGRNLDLVPPFGWTRPEHERAIGERLLLRRPPVLPAGRREILVCPQCADPGCGCVSAAISMEQGYYVWSDFGYENDYDPESLDLFPMGRFIFPEQDVVRLLGRYVCGLRESPA